MTYNTKTASQSGSMLLALLAGVGTGVVVGLAIAPKSGQKMRAQIGDTVNDYLDSASEKAGDIRKSVVNMAQRGQDQVQKTKDNATDKVNDAAAAVNRAVNAGADSARDAIDHTVSAVNAGARKGYDTIDRTADALKS